MSAFLNFSAMTDFQKYIERYLNLIPSGKWLEEMVNSGEETHLFFSQLMPEQANFAYAPGKWTLKEVLQHLIDAEKIFAYRALRFSRQDKTVLPGWDEEAYGKTYDLSERPVAGIAEEYMAVRKSSLLFFQFLNAEQRAQTGIANGNEISVETLGKLIVGHNIHHMNVVKERYLPHFENL